MHMVNNYLNLSFLVFPLFIFLFVFSGSHYLFYAHAEGNLTVIPHNSNPFGKSYSNWTAEWWKWYIGTPFDSNHQSKDLTGSNCGRNQSGPVWFLSGSEQFPSEKT